MYIAQAKCPSISMPYHFYYQKYESFKANKKVNTQTLSTYLLYIIFNINIYGGGRDSNPASR